MKTTYVVTGANSPLGLSLCTELLEKGAKVIAVCRRGDEKFPKGVKIIHSQMSEYSKLDDIVGKADVFVNLAWEGTAKDRRNDTKTQERNVKFTEDAMRAASKMGCKLFVESGSQEEYGNHDGKVTESTVCKPGSAYAKSKLATYEKCSALSKELGIKYIHLRLFCIYGIQSHHYTLIIDGLDKLLSGAALDLSLCEHKWNYLHVDDASDQICRLCKYALEKEDFQTEVFNIASSDTRPLKDFVERMKVLCNSGSELRYGAMTTDAQFSRDPDTSKTDAAIGRVERFSFDDGIRQIIDYKIRQGQVKKKLKTISIVTPCYNEEENIKELYERIKAQFRDSEYLYEHIFIDNASTDKTVEEIKKIARDDSNVKLIVNAMNFGHIRSPFYGLCQATGDAVMLMVSDLQDPPELIPEFIKKWEEGHKVVVGIKNKSLENPVMYALRGVYYSLIKAMSDTPQIENFTGFGLYDQDFIRLLRSIDDPYPYMRGLVAEYGGNIGKVLYTQPKRAHGKTHQSFMTLYDMAMLGFVSHSKALYRMPVFIGVGVCVASVIAAIVIIIIGINSAFFLVGPALVKCLGFFLGGIILFFLGIVGEYVGSISTQVRRRPLVIEKERVNF